MWRRGSSETGNAHTRDGFSPIKREYIPLISVSRYTGFFGLFLGKPDKVPLHEKSRKMFLQPKLVLKIVARLLMFTENVP